jgi:SM-20-related protein
LLKPDSSAYPDATIDTPLRRIIDDLHDRGWSEQDGFLSPALMHALETECMASAKNGMLAMARVGLGATSSLQPAVRGDRIQWLEAGQSEACGQFLEIIEALRTALNRELFLGLHDYEGHFAFYAPGMSYQPHLDRFRGDDSRTVTITVYLNPAWLPEHGGALRLHPEGAATRDILPIGGRTVVFLSADMLHEVLPATRDRIAITGWFRRRAMRAPLAGARNHPA